MKLATINAEGEYQNLVKITNDNPILFNDEVFVSSDSAESEFLCSTFYKFYRRDFAFKPVESADQQSNFMCESVEVSSTFESKESREVIAVKSTFFKALSEDDDDINSKKYYLSRLELLPAQASTACKSFGMKFASPQSQNEYLRIKELLGLSTASASISIVRSPANTQTWLDGNGKTKNFEIDWLSSSFERCAVFKPLKSGLVEAVSCSLEFPFICEDNSLDTSETISAFDRSEFEKFFEKLRSITTETMKIDFAFSKASMKLTFFEARLLCQSLQMELFTPELSLDYSELNEHFFGLEVGSIFYTGMTSMGSSDSWYSVQSGKVLNDITTWQDDDQTSDCSVVVKYLANEFYYKDVDCRTKNSFICQKTTNLTNEFKSDVMDYGEELEA